MLAFPKAYQSLDLRKDQTHSDSLREKGGVNCQGDRLMLCREGLFVCLMFFLISSFPALAKQLFWSQDIGCSKLIASHTFCQVCAWMLLSGTTVLLSRFFQQTSLSLFSSHKAFHCTPYPNLFPYSKHFILSFLSSPNTFLLKTAILSPLSCPTGSPLHSFPQHALSATPCSHFAFYPSPPASIFWHLQFLCISTHTHTHPAHFPGVVPRAEWVCAYYLLLLSSQLPWSHSLCTPSLPQVRGDTESLQSWWISQQGWHMFDMTVTQGTWQACNLSSCSRVLGASPETVRLI